MNWIRIAVRIGRDTDIIGMAKTLGVSTPLTTGCCVLVLCELPEGARDGNIGGVSDEAIEAWAQWPGKRGKFAAAFRAHLCTPEGVVKAWEKHNGSAIRRMEADVERKRKGKIPAEFQRSSTGIPAEFHAASSVDETKTRRDVDDTSHSASDGEDDGRSALAFASIAPCVAPVGHDALRELLRHVQQPETWAGIIRGCASGQSMPEARPASAERIAAAVQDFVAGGHHRDPKALTKLFRGYISNAKASPAQTRHLLNVDDDRAEQLRLLREQNQRRAMRHDALKPEPTWAKEIDAKYPDGRTWPGGVAA